MRLKEIKMIILLVIWFATIVGFFTHEHQKNTKMTTEYFKAFIIMTLTIIMVLVTR